MLFDLHVHTSFSPCSQMSPREVLDRARQVGLNGVCLTDHHSRAAAQVISEGPQPDGLVVLVGQEYATSQGDFLIFGPLAALAPGLPATQLLEMVQRAGGVAVGAHPCRQGRSLDPELAASGRIKVIEGVNGRNLLEENQLASGWGRENGLDLVGGSDAHTPEELGTAGTEFVQVIRGQNDLVRALKSGGFHARWPLKNSMEIFLASRYRAASFAV